jgi:hypothetical protein
MRRTLQISAVIAAVILVAMVFYSWLASHDEQLRMKTTIAAQKLQLDAADARERARATALDQTLAQIQKLKHDTQTPEEILSQLPQYLNLPQPITLNPSPGENHSQPAVASDVGQGKNKKGTGLRLFGRSWFAPKTAPASSDERASGSVASSPISEAASSKAASASNDATAQTLASIEGKTRSNSSPGPADALVELPDAAKRTQVPFSHDRIPSAISQDAATPLSAQIPAADLKPLYDYVQDCRSCQAQLTAAQQTRADDATKLTAMTHERDAALIAAKGGTIWRRFRRNLNWFLLGAAVGAAASVAANAAVSSPVRGSGRTILKVSQKITLTSENEYYVICLLGVLLGLRCGLDLVGFRVGFGWV